MNGKCFSATACGACLADETRAGEVLPGEAPSEKPWRWTGDALLRYEAVRGAPNPMTSDFERLRLRLRPGIDTSFLSGRLALGAGLLVSSASDSNDWNIIRNDNFRSDEVAVDRAWIRVSAPEAAF